MKTMAMIVVVMLICSAALAQTAVKLESNLKGGTSVDLLAVHNGTFSYALVCQNWAEAYVGKVFSPAPWFEIAAGIGLERADDPIRLGGWVWTGQGRYSLLHVWEQGGSGPWHKTIVMAKVNDHLNAGVIDRSFFGRGITAEYKLGQTKLTGALYDGGATTLALSHSF